MANDVYANGREVSCKAADGKSVAAFPDVCLTPPSPPAGPIPIPYPNTGMASDTTDGSKNVKISGKEVNLKDSSCFKKSTGDEAATKAQGMSVITHQIQGKVYYNSWSMDVKIEGENAVRHLDLTTHNHASQIGGTPPIVYADRMALIVKTDDCHKELQRIDEDCDPWDEKAKCPDNSAVTEAKNAQKKIQKKHPKGSPERDRAQQVVDIALEQYSSTLRENDCHQALRCALVPYEKAKTKGNKKAKVKGGQTRGCCQHTTPEHLMPKAQFKSCPGYRQGKAPCMCAEGGKSVATHGLLGDFRKEYIVENGFDGKPSWTMAQSAQCSSYAAHKATDSDCSPECIEAQLKKAHEEMGVTESTPITIEQENIQKNLSIREELISVETLVK